jgi:hypothetical protein
VKSRNDDKLQPSWRGPPDSNGLAHIVNADGGTGVVESFYYETVADPAFVRLETVRRRFRGE